LREGSYEGLNLTPPGEGFELYRHKNARRRVGSGWPGLYWARRVESGGYEIRYSASGRPSLVWLGMDLASLPCHRGWPSVQLFCAPI
jgi:hypothetical protein